MKLTSTESRAIRWFFISPKFAFHVSRHADQIAARKRSYTSPPCDIPNLGGPSVVRSDRYRTLRSRDASVVADVSTCGNNSSTWNLEPGTWNFASVNEQSVLLQRGNRQGGEFSRLRSQFDSHRGNPAVEYPGHKGSHKGNLYAFKELGDEPGQVSPGRH